MQAAYRRVAAGPAARSLRLLSSGASSVRPPLPPIDVPIEPPVGVAAGPGQAPFDLNVSKLDTGMRVASEDCYGLVSTVGVWLPGGSRYESAATLGSTQLTELLMFQVWRAFLPYHSLLRPLSPIRERLTRTRTRSRRSSPRWARRSVR